MAEKMKILVVGGGAREHAICYKLAQSAREPELYAVPGNPGISELAQCVPIKDTEVERITEFAVEKGVDLVVVGPEVPLTMGLTDLLEDRGIRVFGPDKNCARLEGSKRFTKKFLDKYNIPTAAYKEFDNKEELIENIGIFGFPMVIKADGLAAGKGVVIAEDESVARKAIEDMMGKRKFGSAGDRVVVEEFLTGREASCLCFVDGDSIVPMESAQDYKRIFEGDKGPNTGGMGTYSPNKVFTKELEEEIRIKILDPTLKGFKKEGLNFHGVLFIGLMISDHGPKVIEFNTRFGDPETESVLMRLESDLLEIMEAVTEDRLKNINIRWSKRSACCVVAASEGYPGEYPKGRVIRGLELITDPDVVVFHAGTKVQNGELVTNGGRVLAVTAIGNTPKDARDRAFANIEKISFEGMQYRKDIGV